MGAAEIAYAPFRWKRKDQTMLQCANPDLRPNGRRRRLSNVLPILRWLLKITGVRSSAKPKAPKA